jgi:hypothetical protein
MGIYPALQGSHADLVDGLKEGVVGPAGAFGSNVSGKFWSARRLRFR